MGIFNTKSRKILSFDKVAKGQGIIGERYSGCLNNIGNVLFLNFSVGYTGAY